MCSTVLFYINFSLSTRTRTQGLMELNNQQPVSYSLGFSVKLLNCLKFVPTYGEVDSILPSTNPLSCSPSLPSHGVPLSQTNSYTRARSPTVSGALVYRYNTGERLMGPSMGH